MQPEVWEIPKEVHSLRVGRECTWLLLTSGSVLLFSKLQTGIFSCALLPSPEEEVLWNSAFWQVPLVSGQLAGWRKSIRSEGASSSLYTGVQAVWGCVCRASPGSCTLYFVVCSMNQKKLPAYSSLGFRLSSSNFSKQNYSFMCIQSQQYQPEEGVRYPSFSFSIFSENYL